MTFKELNNKNKFIKIVLNNVQVVLKKGLNSNPRLENRRSDLSKKEMFIVDTFHYVMEVLSKIETIDYEFIFLNPYPRNKLWEKMFNRIDYIEYHTECYLNNIIGIFDRYLLLINFLYDLGFQNKDVRYHLIISNEHIRKEQIKDNLENFNTALQNTRSLCNFTKHRGRLSDKNLDEMRMYKFILGNNKIISKRKFELFYKVQLSHYISKQKIKIKKNNNNIRKFCDVLFNNLSGEYKKRLNTFDKNGSKIADRNKKLAEDKIRGSKIN